MITDSEDEEDNGGVLNSKYNPINIKQSSVHINYLTSEHVRSLQ